MPRTFDSPNNTYPASLEVVAAGPVPICFQHRDQWRTYLREVWRSQIDDKPARMALSRGAVPDYCSDCTADHQARMRTAGRCRPPPEARTPEAKAAGAFEESTL